MGILNTITRAVSGATRTGPARGRGGARGGPRRGGSKAGLAQQALSLFQGARGGGGRRRRY